MPGYELIGKEEKAEVNSIFEQGNGIHFRRGFESVRNNSYKVCEFESAFASYMKTNYALAVTSGTAALRVALASIGIGSGDEVITQSFTFVATIEAIIESGANPICVDIDMSLNMDVESLEKSITNKTKAVIVVHMLGTPANLPEIVKVCNRNNIYLIEDTAWGCGGKLNDVSLGTWGDIGTYSFDFAKTMTTGEGGMLVFKNKSLYEKASAWHDHGHENNPLVPRWEDTRSSSGFNFRMSELQAAVGLAQLRKLDSIVESQRKNHELIWKSISDIPLLKVRSSPPGSYATADALIVLTPSKEHAKRSRKYLLQEGLSTKILPEAYTWHFAGTWSHMNELVMSCDGPLEKKFEKSQAILETAVSIPITVKMQEDAIPRIRNSFLHAFNFFQ